MLLFAAIHFTYPETHEHLSSPYPTAKSIGSTLRAFAICVPFKQWHDLTLILAWISK